MLRKYDQNGNLLWRKEYPDIRHSNENLLHLYNGNLIITGRNNQLENPYEHSYYIIDIEGNIIELKRIKLPYEVNFNYGSLIKGDTLYMYGTAREDLSEVGINVDALIVTYDLVKDTFSYEYFDYGHDFVDIWDMRMVEDGSILFYSAHRRQEYPEGLLDYVVERIWPDGERTTVYNVTSNSDGGVDFPQMEYLGDGVIVINFPNEGITNIFYPNFRIINLDGELLFEKWYPFFS